MLSLLHIENIAVLSLIHIFRHGPGTGGERRAGGAADGGGSVRTERIPAAGLPHLAGPGAGLPAEVKTDGTEGSEGKCLRGVPVF